MATIFRHKVVSNTVTFNEAVNAPAGALQWGVDIMDGWKNTGDPEESAVELGSYRDGQSSSSFWPVRNRFVTIGGYAVAASEAGAEALSDVLVRDAFPRNQLLTVTRYEGIPKFVLAKRSSPVEFDWTAVQNGFRWLTTLSCDDPFKYGTTTFTASGGVAGSSVTGHTFPVTFPMTFSGTGNTTTGISLINHGTAYSPHFTATINGTLAKGAWRLSNDTTAKYIGYNVALSTTDLLVIDFRNQIATLNGVLLTSDYIGDFWQLAPGSNTIRLYAEYDVNALASITGYSAWE